MNRFSARNLSEAHVPVDRSDIWDVISDPHMLAELTPLIDRITVNGEHWCWKLSGISALGVDIAPSFTEKMEFTPGERIEFSHEPTAEGRERAGAQGFYELGDTDDGMTRLFVDITIHAELPLPRASRRAVERIMRSSMEATGNRFAENLYKHLDIDESRVRILDPA